MMTMLRAPTAIKQGAERSRSDGLDGVERFFSGPQRGGAGGLMTHDDSLITRKSDAMRMRRVGVEI